MIIYPAIDLRNGKVVRLKEGDPNRQTIFSNDPLATAKEWIAQGANWIHMVNLDGAFNTTNDNLKILKKVAEENINIQFGGGLRSLDSIKRALEMGANRVVLGTIAVENPHIVEESIELFGTESICVALDARDGKVTTHGWEESTVFTPIELGKQMFKIGVTHALYTDIQRDGGLSGVNIDETVDLGHQTQLKVIASGGVTTIEEIQQLKASHQVAGAIIGMALYQEKITLPDALKAART